MAMMTNGKRKGGPWSDFTLGRSDSAQGGGCLSKGNDRHICWNVIRLLYSTFTLFCTSYQHIFFDIRDVADRHVNCKLLNRIVLTEMRNIGLKWENKEFLFLFPFPLFPSVLIISHKAALNIVPQNSNTGRADVTTAILLSSQFSSAQ